MANLFSNKQPATQLKILAVIIEDFPKDKLFKELLISRFTGEILSSKKLKQLLEERSIMTKTKLLFERIILQF